MTLKYKILAVITIVVTSFAIGRFTTPVKTVVQTKIVEVEKKVDNTDTKQNQTETITKKPDGTETTTIITNTDTKNTSVDTTSVTDTSTKTVTKESSKVTISALAGAPISLHGIGLPTYGIAISKEILGPIGVGVFGFTDGVGGVSISLSL